MTSGSNPGDSWSYKCVTLPETNISLKIEPWKRRFLLKNVIFNIFRGELLVLGSVVLLQTRNTQDLELSGCRTILELQKKNTCTHTPKIQCLDHHPFLRIFPIRHSCRIIHVYNTFKTHPLMSCIDRYI